MTGDPWSELPRLFPQFSGAERWLPLLVRHAALVAGERAAGRLTAVTGDDVVLRQYGESLELGRIAMEREPAAVLIDVGSGAGFPGLVIAAVAPEMRVHLVEPLAKRAAFLARTVAELGLENVAVHALRAEDAGRGPLRATADIVAARAVAPLPVLLEYAAPLARTGGLLALAKGSGVAGEIAAAATATTALSIGDIEVVPFRSLISEVISACVARKVAATPERYPRRTGVPQKRPL